MLIMKIKPENETFTYVRSFLMSQNPFLNNTQYSISAGQKNVNGVQCAEMMPFILSTGNEELKSNINPGD